MKNTKPRKTNVIRNSIMAVAAIIIVGIGGIITYDSTRTYPLGDPSKLEYIGKVDYGCWLVCDANPGSTYYYATDMSLNNLLTYFKKISIVKAPDQAGDEVYFGIRLSGGETLYTNYYLNKMTVYKDYALKTTNKRYLLEVPSFKYQSLKNSL